ISVTCSNLTCEACFNISNHVFCPESTEGACCSEDSGEGITCLKKEDDCNSTTTSPEPTTSPKPTTEIPVTTNSPTTGTYTSVPSPFKTTVAPSGRHFDAPSFIGGIVLALGLLAIIYVSFKFYKARTERNYHTL
ncbi:sialomucin core protein 24-like, partial [Stegodyphus dumicola]|uniref:sialomucin core protein 24-like n=1 Tax=Stegodyphus dumicola TaxID=202533 RepID=UPI0015B170BD